MYKKTYRDDSGVTHIVAMPGSFGAFTACGRYQYVTPRAFEVATCVACWAREFIEWFIEANVDTKIKHMMLRDNDA